MRVLRDTGSITNEIQTCPDRSMAQLLADHQEFVQENEEGQLIAIMVEVGDTLAALDEQLDHKLLDNPYGRRKYGEEGFRLCAETLDQYPTFFEIFFIEGDEVGITVLVPKAPGIDAELLALCAEFSSPMQALSS
jgi:hypothetical protein